MESGIGASIMLMGVGVGEGGESTVVVVGCWAGLDVGLEVGC